MKYCLLIGLLQILLLPSSLAQKDSSISNTHSIFANITNELKNYKLDTSAVPNDKLTKLINELISLRGGFNINEAIEFKIAEEKENKALSSVEAENLSQYFAFGNGSRWLNNAIVWIYREQFNKKDLKKLIKFYNSSTGQKMASVFPVLMLKSLAAGEAVKAMYDEKEKGK